MKLTTVSKAKMEAARKEEKARYVLGLLDSLEYSRHYLMNSETAEDGTIIFTEPEEMDLDTEAKLKAIDEIAEHLTKCI